MSEKVYRDYVLVKFCTSDKMYLYQAPGFSFLTTGDIVKVGGHNDGVVVMKETRADDDPYLERLIKAAGAKQPLSKIIARVDYKAFEYDDEEEDF